MRTMLLAPLPILLVGTLVIIASLPWGGPDWLELALSLAPIAAIHFWSVKRPRLMPAIAVFMLGLLADVVMHEPLGVWTSAALVAALAGRWVGSERSDPGVLWRTAVAMVTLALVVCLVGVVTSLHDWKLVAWRPLLEAMLVACLAYPFLSALLSAVERMWPVTEERSLLLRGD